MQKKANQSKCYSNKVQPYDPRDTRSYEVTAHFDIDGNLIGMNVKRGHLTVVNGRKYFDSADAIRQTQKEKDLLEGLKVMETYLKPMWSKPIKVKTSS